MPFAVSKRLKLAGLGSLALALTYAAAASGATASAQDYERESWGEWQPISGGFVGRRREPRSLEEVQRQAVALAQSRATASVAARATAAPVAAATVSPSGWVWVYTDSEGLQSVSIADLAVQLGRSEAQVRSRAQRGKLRLRYGKHATRWHYDATTDAVLFVAETYDTFYTDTNAYHLRLGGDRGQRMATTEGAGPAVTATSTFADSLHFEEEADILYVPYAAGAAPDSDFWFWEVLSTGFPQYVTRTVEIEVPDPAAVGDAQIRIRLRGASDLQAGDDHYVTAELNGVAVGAVSFDAFDEAILVGDDVQGVLVDGMNQLALTISGVPDGGSRVYFDDVELDYQRMPVAHGGQLWVHGADGGVQTVTGFASANIRVVEAPTGAAVFRQDIAVSEDGNGGYAVSFAATSGSDYVVAELGAELPVTVAIDTRSALKRKSNAAEYLIIAPRALSHFAESLATYRSERFQVKTVWLEDIYDEMNAGRVDPAAVTRFMGKVRARWAQVPDYVVLLGKGSIDMKGRLGLGDNLMPIRFVSTPWTAVASDDALLGTDSANDIAVGRIPVVSNEEGLRYLDKLIAYESDIIAGALSREGVKAVLVADNADAAGDFPANSDELASYLEGEAGFAAVEKHYHVAGTDVRDAFSSETAWNSGYVSYDGHGSASRLGAFGEDFLNQADAAALGNTGRPIFTALTCAAGNDWYPDQLSVASILVLNPDGGAIASLAPAGPSLDYDAHQLGSSFVRGLYDHGDTIGAAAAHAKAVNAGVIRAFMPQIYDVKGDPAILAR